MGNANDRTKIKSKLEKYFPNCFGFIIASLTATDYQNLLSAGDNEENFRRIIYLKIINESCGCDADRIMKIIDYFDALLPNFKCKLFLSKKIKLIVKLFNNSKLLNQWFASNEESPQTTIQQSNNLWIPIGRSGATGGSVAPHFIKSNRGLISRILNLVRSPKPNYGIAIAPLLVISQLTYHGYRWNIRKISGKRLVKKSIDCIGSTAASSLVVTGMAAMSVTMPFVALVGGGLLGGIAGQIGMDALTTYAFDLKLDEKVEEAFLYMKITLESNDNEIIDSFMNMAEENNFEKLIESLLIVCTVRVKKTN